MNIISKRPDGYHNLETIFYPVKWTDILEINRTERETKFTCTGLPISGDAASNLCLRAYNLLKDKFRLPDIQFHLHKIIPMGAGLGGGSSDGAFVLKMLNALFNLKLADEELSALAIKLGSDCPFFIFNKPVFATGRGEIFTGSELKLSGYSILVVYPGISVSTADAFSQIIPNKPEKSVNELVKLPIENWKELIHNDFEDSVFIKYPEIKSIKEKLYSSGAIYSSLSGSGSAVYGIYSDKPNRPDFGGMTVWEGILD